MSKSNIYRFPGAASVQKESGFEGFPDWAIGHASAPDYSSGYQSGQAAAMAYLKYLSLDDGGFPTLQSLTLYFADEYANAPDKDARDAMKGKICGMFCYFEHWLRFGLKSATSAALEEATVESIRAVLQDAEEGGPERRLQEASIAARSERARKAARARWDKRNNSPTPVAAL